MHPSTDPHKVPSLFTMLQQMCEHWPKDAKVECLLFEAEDNPERQMSNV